MSLKATTEKWLLVVDNCTYEVATNVEHLARLYGVNLSLLTIEQCESVDRLVGAFDVKPLPNNQLSKIVNQLYELHGNGSYHFNNDRAAYSDSYVAGNIKLLIALVEAYFSHPNIKGIGELTNVETLNLQLTQLIQDIPHTALRTLQGLSLLDGLFTSGHNSPAYAIAELVGVPEAEFKLAMQDLTHAGLVIQDRRSEFVVVPKLLAVRLASWVWQSRGNDIYRQFFVTDENEVIIDNFRTNLLRRLGDIGNQGIAKQIVENLSWYAELSLDEISENPIFYAALGKADLVTFCKYLAHKTASASREDLVRFASHSTFHDMLASGLRLKESFMSAAHVIARFASVDTSPGRQNISEIWRSIFFLRYGGNPASSTERNQLIHELLENSGAERQIVAIKAIASTLDNFESTSVSWNHTGYLSAEPWYPQYWSEFWDARRNVLPLLDLALSKERAEVVEAARECLLQSIRDQGGILLDEMLERVQQLPFTFSYKTKIWKILQEMLKYDSKDYSPEQIQKIKDIQNQYISDSYQDQVLIHISFPDYPLLTVSDDYGTARKELESKLSDLAKLGQNQPDLVNPLIEWIVQLSDDLVAPWKKFLYELALLDDKHIFYPDLVKQIAMLNNWLPLSVYFNGRLKDGDSAWIVEVCRSLIENYPHIDPSILAILTRSGLWQEGTGMILTLVNSGKFSLEQIPFSFEGIEQMDIEMIDRFLNLAIETNTPKTTYLGLAIISKRLNAHPENHEELKNYVLPLLSRPLEERHWIVLGWEDWEEVANSYSEQFPIEITGILLDKLKTSNVYRRGSYDIADVLRVLFSVNSEGVWNQIGERLLLPHDNPQYINPSDLDTLKIDTFVDAQILLAWVRNNTPEAISLLIDLISLDQPVLSPLARTLLIEFGEVARDAISFNIFKEAHSPSELKVIKETILAWNEDKSIEVQILARLTIQRIDEELERYNQR